MIKYTLLLCTFEERRTKDYNKAIEVANNRIDQIKSLLD